MRTTLISREQDTLLHMLVKAARSLRSVEHKNFQLSDKETAPGESMLTHPGLPDGSLSVRLRDLEALVRKGLLRRTDDDLGGQRFAIDPRAYAYYRETPRPGGRSAPRIGISARAYMESGSFEFDYPAAFERWARAEALLPEGDPPPETEAIHSLCTQALHAFAGHLESEFNSESSHPEDARASLRLRAFLDSPNLTLAGDTRHFLDALLTHWETRIERARGPTRESRSVDRVMPWQDLHLAVFHTAVVMFEFDRALSQLR